MTTARLFAVSLFACVSGWTQQVGNVAFFASGKPLNATEPGAVAVIGDLFQQTVWVSYTNGASHLGDGGSSTVVEYNTEGKPLHRYTVAGSVDGLKEDPDHHVMWALQNAGGNSTLTLLGAESGINPRSPFLYAVESPTRGYRDVAFLRGQAFLSLTGPGNPSDATVQQIAGQVAPLPVNDVLLAGATGVNLATGETGQPTSQLDPGSLRITPLNDLMLVSGSNGQLIFIQDVGTPRQSISFLNVLDSSRTPVTGVSDALFPRPGQNLFFLTNPTTNVVLLVYIFDIQPGQLLALADSMNALVKIDLTTGIASPVLAGIPGYQRMAALKIPGEIR